MTKASTPEVLDLTTPVTAEQFRAAFQGLWEATRTLITRHGWCGQWRDVARRVTPLFPQNQEIAEVTIPAHLAMPDTAFTPDGLAQYGTMLAAELRAVRGRVLTVASNGHITLAEANGALATAGLPQVTLNTDRSWEVYMPYLYVSAPADAVTTEIRARIAAAVSAIEGVSPISEDSIEFSARRNESRIPPAETAPLL